jgi:hypothetical protein
MKHMLISGLANLFLASCIVPAPPAETSGTPLATADKNAATLEGYAQRIDGNDTGGRADIVSLSPGCHVAVTHVREASKDSNGTIRPRMIQYFEFEAKAGYRYVIDRQQKYVGVAGGLRSGRSSVSVEVRTLVEYDQQGVEVRHLTEQSGSRAPTSC